MTLNQAIMELVMISEHHLMPTILRGRLQGIIDAMSEWDEPERWIPVSERLPEVRSEGEIEFSGRSQLEMLDSTFSISEPVQVTRRTNRGYKVITAQWEVDGYDRKYWVNEDGSFVDGVIAWKPLPEPFKGGGAWES